MIRKATLDDLNAVLKIIAEVKILMNAGGNPQWNSDYPGEHEYRADIAREELWLEELEEGMISGFMVVNDQLSKEYRDADWSTPGPSNSIHRLAVNPLCRGRGVAKRLFTFAEQLSRDKGMKSIHLDTFAMNRAAQSLFKSNGYSFAGEIHMKGRSTPYLCYEKSL